MGASVEGASKGFLSSALLVAAVGAILLAGLALRTQRADSQDEPSPGIAPPPALGARIESQPAPEPLPPPPAVPSVAAEPEPSSSDDPALTRLAKRAEADAIRLSAAREPWTAQILVACKAETVDRLLVASGGSDRVYVLPTRVRDEACFRVCYGTYASAKEAAAAADLPASLRGGERVGSVEIVRVLP
jgi:septal ring-binding cell division protein DamX